MPVISHQRFSDFAEKVKGNKKKVYICFRTVQLNKDAEGVENGVGQIKCCYVSGENIYVYLQEVALGDIKKAKEVQGRVNFCGFLMAAVRNYLETKGCKTVPGEVGEQPVVGQMDVKDVGTIQTQLIQKAEKEQQKQIAQESAAREAMKKKREDNSPPVDEPAKEDTSPIVKPSNPDAKPEPLLAKPDEAASEPVKESEGKKLPETVDEQAEEKLPELVEEPSEEEKPVVQDS